MLFYFSALCVICGDLPNPERGSHNEIVMLDFHWDGATEMTKKITNGLVMAPHKG